MNPRSCRERTARLALCGVVALAAMSASMATPPAHAAASAPRIAEHIRILASPEYEGRFPGSAGETRTIEYLVAQFRAAGLAPGGETVNGKRTWFQSVPMIDSRVAGPVRATVATPAGEIQWAEGEQIAIRSTLQPVERLDVSQAPLVFGGSTVADPARAGHEFDDADLAGKVVLLLARAPGRTLPNDRPSLRGRGAPLSKARQAALRGAKGVLLIFEPETLGYPWQTIRTSFRQPRTDIDRTDPIGRPLALEGFVQAEPAKALFKAADLDFAALRAAGESPAFHPVDLRGVTISVSYPVAIERKASRTVIGWLRGARHPDETLMFGAHWDHMGVGAPDVTGDRVYHGALDNASGVATLLEIARNLGRARRPERSIAFVAWTLEEPGLLGSTWYAEHPVFPPARTVAYVNFDTMLPIGRAQDFTGWGYDESGVGALIAQAGARQGRHPSPIARPEWNLKVRSDHYPLMREGIPAVFFLSGTDLRSGGRTLGDKYLLEYFAHRYHQQSDRYDASWDLSGTAEDVDLLVDYARRLANSREWPAWNAASEFAPARNETAEQRR